jgi:50S ribosomal protein L16 3-hydroxylase
MDVDVKLPLLGGLSPAAFMRRHWQKKPLLVRQALPGVVPPVSRARLFALAGSEDVESRLVVQDGERWSVRHGPLARRVLPPVARPRWSLLVQGLDLHASAAHEMLARFRFVPDARLDDLMISWASDGGGVGPHLDSYDVFLIQVHGRRRWRIGRPVDDAFVPGLPLKILQRFEPEQEWVLEPGDMLYLPPRWAHDGVAEGECMTCSVGFRAAGLRETGREVLQRLIDADADETDAADRLYRDPGQGATAAPGEIPAALREFAAAAVRRLAAQPLGLACALGEWLTEPKPQVWFQPGEPAGPGTGLWLDPRSRMMYDKAHVYLNGESFRAGGRDARLMRVLADERRLPAAACRGLGAGARDLIDEWIAQGWVHGGTR